MQFNHKISGAFGGKVSRIAVSVAIAALVLPGCTSIRDHRGYIMDPALTSAIQPGIDNRQSVEGTLGQPSFASDFGAPVWYYVSSTTEQRVFGKPQTEKHQVLRVAFDPAGNVSAVETRGLDAIHKINPDGDSTRTMGRDSSFFEDLFGNIGTVGSGANTPSGPGPNGS